MSPNREEKAKCMDSILHTYLPSLLASSQAYRQAQRILCQQHNLTQKDWSANHAGGLAVYILRIQGTFRDGDVRHSPRVR